MLIHLLVLYSGHLITGDFSYVLYLLESYTANPETLPTNIPNSPNETSESSLMRLSSYFWRQTASNVQYILSKCLWCPRCSILGHPLSLSLLLHLLGLLQPSSHLPCSFNRPCQTSIPKLKMYLSLPYSVTSNGIPCLHSKLRNLWAVKPTLHNQSPHCLGYQAF